METDLPALLRKERRLSEQLLLVRRRIDEALEIELREIYRKIGGKFET